MRGATPGNPKKEPEMSTNLSRLNSLLPQGVTAEFIRAEDESVDDEIMLYVDNHAESVGGIQLSSGRFCPNVWTSTAKDAMHFGRETKSISAATTEAVRLLRKYGWL
jgi:hypothetical protein